MMDFSDPTIALASAPLPSVLFAMAIGAWFIWRGIRRCG